jgi:hypothetical protein
MVDADRVGRRTSGTKFGKQRSLASTAHITAVCTDLHGRKHGPRDFVCLRTGPRKACYSLTALAEEGGEQLNETQNNRK